MSILVNVASAKSGLDAFDILSKTIDKKATRTKKTILTSEEQQADSKIIGNPFFAIVKNNQIFISKKDEKNLSGQDRSDLRFHGFKYDDKNNLVSDLGGADKIAYILDMRVQKKKIYEQSQAKIASEQSRKESDVSSSNAAHDESRAKEWEEKKGEMPSPNEINKAAASLFATQSNAFNALRHAIMNTDYYKSERDGVTPSDTRKMIPFNNAVSAMRKALNDSGINSDNMSDVDAFIFMSNSAKNEPNPVFNNPAIKSLMANNGGGYWGFRAVTDKKLGELLNTKIIGGSDKQNSWANSIVQEALFEYLIKNPKDMEGAEAFKNKLEKNTPGKIIDFRNYLSQIT